MPVGRRQSGSYPWWLMALVKPEARGQRGGFWRINRSRANPFDDGFRLEFVHRLSIG
jgi:hypothetical protein